MHMNWNGYSTIEMGLTLDPSLFWAGALVGALAWAVLSARKSGFDPRDVYWAGVLGLLFGIWGGHLLGIFYYGTDGRPFAWLRFWSGGQAQYGGLIAGALAVIVYVKVRGFSILRYADAMAPAVALGVAVGRIGCFLNGDDFGKLSQLPWAVRFPIGSEAYADHLTHGWINATEAWSLPVHPVQLYCSVFWLGLFALLATRRSAVVGVRFGWLMIAHGVGRFAEQLIRGDFRATVGPLSLTQVISLALAATGLGLLAAATLAESEKAGARPQDTLLSANQSLG
jgi:phosphatidylglycerol:prolipoprotein diacylglycerol transferase